MRNLLKLLLCALTMTVGFSEAKAQLVTMKDINGTPLRTLQYTDVQGSAYLSDNWNPGTVKLINGSAYENILLKYDQVADQLQFKSANDQSMVFADPVQEFSIHLNGEKGAGTKVFRRSFLPANGETTMPFYEVLTDGKTPLLKRSSKSISEEKVYSEATTIKKVQQNISYYIATSDKPVKIKNNIKSVTAVLPDKASEMEAYVKENKLNLKEEADLAKLVAYYNSLN